MEEAQVNTVLDSGCTVPDDTASVMETSDTTTPQEHAPMIEVQDAVHAASSWREFFVHIATIVLGLLIAVGLEQTVEHIHHLHQAYQVEQALYDDNLTNRLYVRRDMELLEQGLGPIRANMNSLNDSLAHGSPFVPVSLARRVAYRPPETAWLTLRQNGLLSLVPARVANSYWIIDQIHQRISDVFTEADADRAHIDAILHLHPDPAQMTEQERHDLLMAYSDLYQNIVRSMNELKRLSTVNEMTIAGTEVTIENFEKWDGAAVPSH
jgi:hypothetical protein